MTAPALSAAAVESAENITDLADDLRAIHPGLDLICDGARLLALDPNLTPDRTQTLIAALAGGTYGNPDLLRLITELIRHLGNPDTNPALAKVPAPRAELARDMTAKFATDLDDYTPRHLTAEAAAALDPYTD